MHFDFSSAIDNARLIAERDAALRRCAQHNVAVQLKSSRWCALPATGRTGTRSRAEVPAVNLHPAAQGSTTHAH
ncbi:MAG: hypothetical protein PSV13_09370 [Lacunisphaera sp.]|nr:hypothetical protein [Lacunisphaera sp.]